MFSETGDFEKQKILNELKSFLNACRPLNDFEGVVTHLSFGDIIQGKFIISNEKLFV